jgi:hypothetical protein
MPSFSELCFSLRIALLVLYRPISEARFLNPFPETEAV